MPCYRLKPVKGAVVVIFSLLLNFYSVDAQLCGGALQSNHTEQSITFPGANGPVDCQWTILTTEPSTYVRLIVHAVLLPATPDCQRDRIEVWSGGAITEDKEPVKLCGTDIGKWNYFLSTGAHMLVRFVSAGLPVGHRFNFQLSYISEDDIPPRLLWTERKEDDGRVRVHSLPADPHSYLTSGQITTRYYYQTAPGNWLAIASDRRDRTIFWSDSDGKRIIRGFVGQHSAGKAIFVGTSSEVEGIAVDWMARTLYLTDALYNWILVMNYDATIILRLVTSELDVPRAIAVHPMRSFLFWTDCGLNPRIERSNLAGQDRQVIVSSQLTSPNGITVDFQSQRIFWTDVGLLTNKIESALLDGSDRQTLLALSSLGVTFAHLTAYQDYIFVTDRDQQLRCVRKSAPGQQYFGLNIDAKPFGITVYDTEPQPAVDSPCASSPCSHLCVGTARDPHYKCLCPDGHHLMPDLMNCEDEASIAPPQLFLATQTRLCRWPSNFPTMTIPPNYNMSCFLTGRQHAVALAIDVKENKVFFSDVGAKNIASATLRANSKIVLISGGIRSVEGIAVDWISKNVYWTDNPANKITVSTYDGQFQKDLITTDIIHPRAIAVDPFERYMFWGEFGDSPQIERADLDGSNRVVIISEDLQLPNGFTLDYAKQMLYFGDAATGAIQTVGYSGQDKTILLQKASSTHNFFGMTMFQDFLLWTEFGNGNGIYVANRNTGEMVKELPVPNEGIFGLAMYADYNQPQEEGPCSIDNGGCNQLCLPSTTALEGRVCECSFGSLLDEDQTTCISGYVEDNFVLFTDTYLKKVFQVDLTDVLYAPKALPLGTMTNPIAIAYDPQDKRVYWSDVVEHTINRAGLDGSQKQIIISEDIQTPDGLTIDPTSRLMFWTDVGRVTISVATLTGQRRTTLISDGLEKPRAIALHTQEGYMYWTDWGSIGKIERSFMDGTGRQTLVNTDLGWPNGLVVDTEARKLYWCDAQVDKIETADLDGSNRHILIDFNVNAHTYGIGVYGDHLFWTDWAQTSLIRASKLTGENTLAVGSSQLRRPNELHIYSSSVPSPGYEACLVDNGGCDGLCLPSANGRSCKCGDADGGTSAECEELQDIQCSLEFDEGELGADCTGAAGEVCSVNCWTGFTKRFASVICLSTGTWDEDLGSVCEEELIVEEEVSDLTVYIQTSIVTPGVGDMVNLDCIVNDESVEISWYKDGVLLEESGSVNGVFILNGDIIIISFDFVHQGRYSCSAYRDGDGAFSEAGLTFTLPLVMLFQSYPENATVELGGDHLLPCAPVNRLHRIVWEKNGAQLLPNEHVFQQNGDHLFILDATLSVAGLYSCVLYDGSKRIRDVSARISIDAQLEIDEVCGTITAEEAIDTRAGTEGSFRLVGGRKAIHGSAPWMARLYHRSRRQHFCGGSLINNYWVITAAHCIRESRITTNDLMVRLGDYDTRQTDDSEALIMVDEIHIPSEYNSTVYDQDIALLKLSTPVYRFTNYIRPLCFPNITIARSVYKIGYVGRVTGWGQIAESGPYPRYMTELSLPLVGKRRCRASTDEVVTTNMFCAGYPRESGDACRGDSGGPFAVEYNDRWYLLGIVSWGEGCGQDGKYGFYTRVAKFIDWTNDYIST